MSVLGRDKLGALDESIRPPVIQRALEESYDV